MPWLFKSLVSEFISNYEVNLDHLITIIQVLVFSSVLVIHVIFIIIKGFQVLLFNTCYSIQHKWFQVL